MLFFQKKKWTASWPNVWWSQLCVWVALTESTNMQLHTAQSRVAHKRSSTKETKESEKKKQSTEKALSIPLRFVTYNLCFLLLSVVVAFSPIPSWPPLCTCLLGVYYIRTRNQMANNCKFRKVKTKQQQQKIAQRGSSPKKNQQQIELDFETRKKYLAFDVSKRLQ